MRELEAAQEYDYIVVGSGAGGGPLACNLARSGYTVLLLEAGGDSEDFNYQVPAFHPKASEDETVRWDFFVRHYANEARQKLDPKYCEQQGGVLYPRSGVLGGCTAHNAMICVYPHNADWQAIEELTLDRSWAPARMRGLFERLENNGYRPFGRFFDVFGINPTRHGYHGWLHTEAAAPREAVGDREVVSIVLDAIDCAVEKSGDAGGWVRQILSSQLDPNAWSFVKKSGEGVCFTPLATRQRTRNGTREYLRATQREFRDKLFIEVDALAVRVLLDSENVARGVEFLKGPRLYRADPRPSPDDGDRRFARARREVVLSAGVYNTPQLLMLSGIGPPEELAKHGIEVRVPLRGVGRNLQDRYEVGVVSRLKKDFIGLRDATYSTADPQFDEWKRDRSGMYATNGTILAIIKRSDKSRPLPDLFLMGLVGSFCGYFPGYSDAILKRHDTMTWAILKAHTENRAGSVTLRSADPRDPPIVNFRYFEEGDDAAGADLDAVVHGIEFARSLLKSMAHVVEAEEIPGPNVQSNDELREFVRNNAWGHHASCTCPIGNRDDPMAVLDGDFRVYGTKGLRVVDASVFPRIPGFFIVSAVYMVSEKATDVILRDARAKGLL